MVRYCFLAGLVLLCGGAWVCAGEPQVSEPKIGAPPPEINAVAWLNSPPLTLAKAKQKMVVVEFWATWCGPCRTAIPHLIELYEKYKSQGVVIIGLSDEPLAKITGFVKEMKMTYPVGAGSTSAKAYGVTGIPHAFVIAPGGKLVWSGHPAAGLDKALADALRDTPPGK